VLETRDLIAPICHDKRSQLPPRQWDSSSTWEPQKYPGTAMCWSCRRPE